MVVLILFVLLSLANAVTAAAGGSLLRKLEEETFQSAYNYSAYNETDSWCTDDLDLHPDDIHFIQLIAHYTEMFDHGETLFGAQSRQDHDCGFMGMECWPCGLCHTAAETLVELATEQACELDCDGVFELLGFHPEKDPVAGVASELCPEICAKIFESATEPEKNVHVVCDGHYKHCPRDEEEEESEGEAGETVTKTLNLFD